MRFFYPCPQHHHCHGHSRPHFTVTTTASNSASAHISHGSQRNPSLVQLTSTVSVQEIIADVAGLNCASVCLSVPRKKRIVCRRTFHQHTRSTLVLSKGRTISASRQVLEQIQRRSLFLCAKLNYSQCPALSEQ